VNLSKISSIAEIVSTLAIVLTLIYLVVQTQQNSDAINSAARQAVMLADVELLMSRGSQPQKLLLLCEDDVTPEEEIMRSSELIALLRIREIAWLQYQTGVLDEQTWASYSSVLPSGLATEAARDWWAETSRYFDKDFVAYVDSYVAANPVAADWCD